MTKNIIIFVLNSLGVDSGIVQMFTPAITVIGDILDGITLLFLARIWGKITGKKASPTPNSAKHNTPKTLSPHYRHPLPETIHTFATDFETKPHFRNYVYINTQRIFDIISLIINKIFTLKFTIFIIPIICCLWILKPFLPLSTIII